MKLDDASYLRRTFAVAEAAVCASDYGFAAVLVDDLGAELLWSTNEILATGDRTAHAESLICRRSSSTWSRDFLSHCTLYSSTEPCVMCSGAIGWSGIGRLVFGISQGGMNKLDALARPRFSRPIPCRDLLASVSPPIEVIGPLLEDEAARAHLEYVRRHPA